MKTDAATLFSSRRAAWMAACPEFWIMRLHIVIPIGIFAFISARVLPVFITIPAKMQSDDFRNWIMGSLFCVSILTSLFWAYLQIIQRQLRLLQRHTSGYSIIILFIIALLVINGWPLLFALNFDNVFALPAQKRTDPELVYVWAISIMLLSLFLWLARHVLMKNLLTAIAVIIFGLMVSPLVASIGRDIFSFDEGVAGASVMLLLYSACLSVVLVHSRTGKASGLPDVCASVFVIMTPFTPIIFTLIAGHKFSVGKHIALHITLVVLLPLIVGLILQPILNRYRAWPRAS